MPHISSHPTGSYWLPRTNHSLSLDHLLRSFFLRTAIATAFFCPTRTTSCRPRVTPV